MGHTVAEQMYHRSIQALVLGVCVESRQQIIAATNPGKWFFCKVTHCKVSCTVGVWSGNAISLY